MPADPETSAIIDAMIETLWPEVEAKGVELNRLFAEASIEVDNPSVLALLLIWCESAQKVGMDKMSALILLDKFFENSEEKKSTLITPGGNKTPGGLIIP